MEDTEYYKIFLLIETSAAVSNNLLEYTLSLARDLAYIWPRGPHQYYLCATPPSIYQTFLYLIIY